MKSVVALCALTACGTLPALADDDIWHEWMQKGAAMVRAGDYAGAIAPYSEALKLAQHSTPIRLANTLNSLANTYDDTGNAPQAEKYFLRALAVLTKDGQNQTAGYAMVESNLASHYAEHSQADKAKPLFAGALAIYERVAPPDDERAALARNGLAIALLDTGRYKAAEQCLQTALAVFRNRSNPAAEAISLNNLGALRRVQRRNEEAVELFQRAVGLLRTEFGPDHPILLRSMGNLAFTYGVMGRNAEADSLFQQSLSIAGERLGAEHPLYGALMLNYSAFLRGAGRKKEAKKFETQARAVLHDNARRTGAGMTIDAAAFR